MSRDLFRDDLPVVITSRPGAPLLNAEATLLKAVLTLSPNTTLSFSLSDLKDRLFIASFDLSAAEYPAVRDAQSLRVDFLAFPHRVADLLRRPATDPTFCAHLVLPDDATDDDSTERAARSSNPAPSAAPVTFSILQTNNFKVLRHLDLGLSLAPAALVRRALADAIKSAEATRADATARASLASARAETAEAQLNELRPDATAAPRLRGQVADLEARLAEMTAELATLRPAAEEVGELRSQAVKLRDDLTSAAAERDEARKELAARGGELGQTQGRLRDAVAEVRRANRALSRLEESSKTARQRFVVAEAVVERQEAVVGREEKRAAAAERELRRARDREEMLIVERDGGAARLEAARERIEEAEALHASNQQVIAYLNRQLNSRAIARQQGTGGGGGGRRSRRPTVSLNFEDGELGDQSSGGVDLFGDSSSGGGRGDAVGGAGQLAFVDNVGGESEPPRSSVAGPSAFPLSPAGRQGGSSAAGPAVS